MSTHDGPLTRYGSKEVGWIALCSICYKRVMPLMSEASISQMEEMNRTLLKKIDKRIDAGVAGQEESILKTTFGQFSHVNLVETFKSADTSPALDTDKCLFLSFEAPTGNSRAEIRERALTDRLSAAYRDLVSED